MARCVDPGRFVVTLTTVALLALAGNAVAQQPGPAPTLPPLPTIPTPNLLPPELPTAPTAPVGPNVGIQPPAALPPGLQVQRFAFKIP